MKDELIGISPNMVRVQQLIHQIADTGLSTLICGKTGVGKELVVKQLKSTYVVCLVALYLQH